MSEQLSDTRNRAAVYVRYTSEEEGINLFNESDLNEEML